MTFVIQGQIFVIQGQIFVIQGRSTILALNHEDLALNHEDLALNHEDLALNHEDLADVVRDSRPNLRDSRPNLRDSRPNLRDSRPNLRDLRPNLRGLRLFCCRMGGLALGRALDHEFLALGGPGAFWPKAKNSWPKAGPKAKTPILQQSSAVFLCGCTKLLWPALFCCRMGDLALGPAFRDDTASTRSWTQNFYKPAPWRYSVSQQKVEPKTCIN